MGHFSKKSELLSAEGRIQGVFKLGDAWAIPQNAKKPQDPRKEKKESSKNECN